MRLGGRREQLAATLRMGNGSEENIQSRVKQRREFSSRIEIQRPKNFRRSNDCKVFYESRWKLRALTVGKFSTLFDAWVAHLYVVGGAEFALK